MSRAIKSIKKLLAKGRLKVVTSKDEKGRTFCLGYRRVNQPENKPDSWEFKYKTPQLLHDPNAIEVELTETDVDGPAAAPDLPYGEFLKRVCDIGVKDCASIRDDKKRIAAVDGFTICRGKDVDAIRDLYKETQETLAKAVEQDHPDKDQYAIMAASVATVAELVSLVLKRNGLPVILEITDEVAADYAMHFAETLAQDGNIVLQTTPTQQEQPTQ